MKQTLSHIDPGEVAISIQGLHKSFGQLQVLKGMDITVQQGENLAVLGRSACGKSVLIKLIAGMLVPDKGTITVLGKQVNTLHEKEWQLLRLTIGFSFQGSALYDSMTVRENIEFPLIRNKRKLTRAEINKAVEAVLDDVGLLNAVDQWPSELSGGQRKRVGIARTLVLHPQIMLYDEPTSGLDPLTCVEINHLINEVQTKYNTTSIIITHDLTCAKNTSDRVAVIVDGVFARQGSFEDVFTDSTDPVIRGFYEYNFIR